MNKTRLTLDCLPPSVNAIWRFTKGGKMYRTTAYMTWQNGEAWNLTSQMRGQHKFTGPVYITLAMKRRRANQDGDNYSKGVFDLLEHLKIIDNDKHVMGCNWFWTRHLPEGIAAEISITEADALEDAA
jgi:Holliday junction resolvase RusA-like endonuclease